MNGSDLLLHQDVVVPWDVCRNAQPVVLPEDADGPAAATGAEVLAGLARDPGGKVNSFEGYDDPALKVQRWVCGWV
jgi:hypothetical protein